MDGILLLFARLLFSTPNGSESKVLVVRTGSIGDGLVAFSAFQQIRSYFGDSEITLFTNQGVAEKKSFVTLIPEHFIFQEFNYFEVPISEVIAQLRRDNYDVVVYLGQRGRTFKYFRDALIFRRCGIKKAVGFRWSSLPFLQRKQAQLFEFDREEVRLLDSISALGGNVINRPMPQRSPVLLPATDKPFLAFALGGFFEFNRYPLEHWKLLYAHFSERFELINIGGGTDYELGAAIGVSPEKNFAGKLDLRQSADVLAQCVLTLSHDTGPMHLSYSVGTPVVGIFSAWQLPNIWSPPPELGVAIRNDAVPCAQCYTGCQTPICIQNIAVSQVIYEVEALLNSHQKRK